MISLQNISKSFHPDFWKKPFLAVDNLSFEVPEGQITGYLGANGAGKTTSLKMILGFIRPTSGEIHIKGTDNGVDFRSFTGFLPERPYFYPYLTGQEFLSYMGELSSVPKALVLERQKKWAPHFSIDHALDRKLQSYSKGMLQRLGFVAMLLHDPKLLILDEPISGLDPVGRKELKDAIKDIHKEGKTIFFSTHIVSDVQEICKTVIFIEKGKLIYQGPIEKILNENRNSNISVRFSGNQIPDLQHEVLDNGIFSTQVTPENRDVVIKKLVENQYSILEVSSNQPTLEEIFYKVRAEKY